MSVVSPERVAVIIAQAALRKHDPSVKVDGILGPVTRAAFSKAPPAVQATVDQALADSTQYAGFAGMSASLGTAAEHTVLTPMQLQQYIATAFQQSGSHVLDPTQVLGFIQIEDGHLDPMAGRDTPYKGLMQMSSPAWAAASLHDTGLGPYSKNWPDPILNIRAGLAYADANAATLKRFGYTGPITPAVLYAAHNQGAGGFLNMLKIGVKPNIDAVSRYLVSIGQRTAGGRAAQSPSAIRTIALSLAEAQHQAFTQHVA